MMSKKGILAAFALAGICLAGPTGAWVSMAALTLVASAAILGITLALGTAFNVNELQMLSKEEFYQLIATAVMVVLLFSADSFFNNTFSVLFGDASGTLQEASAAKLQAILDNQVGIYSIVKSFSVQISSESTESFYCTLSGLGFNVAPCNGFSALLTPLSMVMQSLALGIAEISSLLRLVLFGDRYAFQLLLPFGILLRTFKATRGAGGLVIGFAAALYLFLPLAVMMMDGLTSPGAVQASSVSLPGDTCDVYDFSNYGTSMNYDNADTAKDVFSGLMGSLDSLLYIFLVQGTMSTIMCLLAFYASMSWIAKLAGADVDLMPLMRVA